MLGESCLNACTADPYVSILSVGRSCWASRKQLVAARASNDQDAAPSHPQATLDINRLQTALSRAVAAEDYSTAALIRDQLNSVEGPDDGKPTPPSGWQGLGIPEWLADRVERLGYMLPTDIQRQTSKLMLLGADVFLSAQTGSGKTLAFLIPVLAMLEYQPGAYVSLIVLGSL